MPKAPQGRSYFFHIESWHLLAMTLLFGFAAWNLFQHVNLPIPLTGDYILVAATTAGLILFGWRYHSQRS